MRRASPLLFGFVTAAATVAATAAAAAAAADPEPRRRTWFEQVERDRDRGAGRIVDDWTWEAQRMEERRDVRLGRAQPRRPFDRFDEDRDRELQIERNARRQDRRTPRGIGASDSTILSRPPASGGGAGLPTLAAVVAKDQRDLAEAKETLGRSLRAIEAAEARELRLLRRRLTREGRAAEYDHERQAVEQRYEQTRASHQAVYDAVRTRIRGASRP